MPAIDLTTVSQLEKSLSNLHSCTVYLVQEQDNTFGASGHKPVWCVPRCSLATIGQIGSVRKTKQITFCHLTCSTLDNWLLTLGCNLINHLRLTNTVTTTDQDWKASIENAGDSIEEGFEVECHLNFPCLRVEEKDTVPLSCK
jgi:hypothetical protein